MALLDLFRGVFSKRQPDVPLREARGVTIDPDEDGWRPLTSDMSRDLSPMTRRRMQEVAVFLWKSNPLVNRLVELPLVFLLAEGVSLTASAEEAQEWLDEFWKDPITRMDIKLPKLVREMALFGEQCWPVFRNQVTGHIRLGYLDPSRIGTVVFDPENATQPIGIVTARDQKGRARRYRVIVNGPEDVFTERTQEIRQSFSDGECFYYTVNDLCTAGRGHSDFLAQMDWADAYDKALFGELERWDFLRAFIWDVTLKGATKEEVDARAKTIQVPPAGGIRVHNDSEEWKAETPDLQSVDGSSFARLFRNHIMGGGTIPEHWYGGGGDVNRATAGEMGEPTFKAFSFRQRIWKHILEEVGDYAIRSRALATGRSIDEDADYRSGAIFPELTTRDTSAYAAALQQVVTAVSVAVERGLMSKGTAVALIGSVAGRLGVEIDAQAELEAAIEDSEKAAELDQFPDLGGDDA